MPLRDKGGESPQITHLMKALDLTEEQAIELMKSDERIDKGERLFELSQEGRQVERAMKQTHSVDAYGKPRVRERKEDRDKRYLIDEIAAALLKGSGVGEVEITNAEREITFNRNGRKFKIVLSAPRN